MSKELVFNNPITAGYILVEDNVITKMNRYRQRMADANEAGGLLLGFRRGPHLEIIDITEPYPNDVRRRTYFYRCDSSHKKHAKKQWKKSKKTIDYLGEWHTHPELIPTPSGLDQKEWGVLVNGRDSSLAFFILGITDIWAGVGNDAGVLCSTAIE